MSKFEHDLFFCFFIFSFSLNWIIYNLSFIMISKFLNYKIIWHLLCAFYYSSPDSPVFKPPIKIQFIIYQLSTTNIWMIASVSVIWSREEAGSVLSLFHLFTMDMSALELCLLGYFCSSLSLFWVRLLCCGLARRNGHDKGLLKN